MVVTLTALFAGSAEALSLKYLEQQKQKKVQTACYIKFGGGKSYYCGPLPTPQWRAGLKCYCDGKGTATPGLATGRFTWVPPFTNMIPAWGAP
jgi:hypothetical protein